MKAEQRSRAAGKEKEYGLVAAGTSGSWHVSIDETVGGAQEWFAQLEGPKHYLYFEIIHAKVMAEILDFFKEHLQRTAGSADSSQWSEKTHALKLGRCGGHSVELLWDRGPADRCFLLVCGGGEFCLRVVLDRVDVEELAGALEQVRQSLCEDGVLSNLT